ncbi:hypothetical protein GF325_18125 [Candidatus Bathyarchaeota archaeon]|nr:hypothetical protein [Candidatus Bathyarchaeota archaeon]
MRSHVMFIKSKLVIPTKNLTRYWKYVILLSGMTLVGLILVVESALGLLQEPRGDGFVLEPISLIIGLAVGGAGAGIPALVRARRIKRKCNPSTNDDTGPKTREKDKKKKRQTHRGHVTVLK